MMGAGLEADIGRGALRRSACLRESRLLGVGAPSGHGVPAPDDPAVAHDDASDGGVGPASSLAAPGKRQGVGHVAGVGAAHPSSGSESPRGSISLTNLSKSSAAWKFL